MHVSKVVEAHLDVKSHGGDVELGQIRAYSATVNTLAANKCGKLMVRHTHSEAQKHVCIVHVSICGNTWSTWNGQTPGCS